MELLKRLVVEEEGQGLVEYTLIVLLVALVFWVAIRSTNANQALSSFLDQYRWRAQQPDIGFISLRMVFHVPT